MEKGILGGTDPDVFFLSSNCCLCSEENCSLVSVFWYDWNELVVWSDTTEFMLCGDLGDSALLGGEANLVSNLAAGSAAFCAGLDCLSGFLIEGSFFALWCWSEWSELQDLYVAEEQELREEFAERLCDIVCCLTSDEEYEAICW
jgi:hypothetical protein